MKAMQVTTLGCLAVLLCAGFGYAGIAGDINADGRIDLQEAIHALQVSSGVYPDLDPSCLLTGKGAWVSGTNYVACDVVESQGKQYACTQGHASSPSNAPPDTDYWTLLSLGGDGPFVREGNDIYYVDGNVGIGTETPQTPLHIQKTDTDKDVLLVQEATGGEGNSAAIAFKTNSDEDSPSLMARIRVVDRGLFDADMAFELAETGSPTLHTAEMMRITREGNVGIGTQTPTEKLEVSGTVKAAAFVGDGSGLTGVSALSGAGAGAENALYVDNAGKVGIGTTTPAATLSVEAPEETAAVIARNSGDTQLALQTGGDTEVYIQMGNRDTDTDAWMLGMDDDETFRLAYGAKNEIRDGDTLVTLHQSGDMDLKGNLDIRGAIRLPNEGGSMTLISNDRNLTGPPGDDGFRIVWDDDFFGTDNDALVFEKTDSNHSIPDSGRSGFAFVNTGYDGVQETAVAIKGDGNVGIGTNNPNARLHVQDGEAGTSTPGGSLLILEGTNGLNYLSFQTPNTSGAGITFGDPENRMIGIIDYNHADDSMWFHVGDSQVETFKLQKGKAQVRGDLSVSGSAMVENELRVVQGSVAIGLGSDGPAEGILHVNGGDMRITNGDLGIGTASPTAPLHVQANSGNLVNVVSESNEADIELNISTDPDADWEVGVNNAGSDSSQFYVFVDTSYLFSVQRNGDVGIGTTSPETKLHVDGDLKANGDIIATGSFIANGTALNVPDYVFEPGYRPMPLAELDAFIKENRHLPEIPSERQIKANGLDMADTLMRLLKKVEELTLYTLEQQGTITDLEEKVRRLEAGTLAARKNG